MLDGSASITRKVVAEDEVPEEKYPIFIRK
jgi:hypothetical protein